MKKLKDIMPKGLAGKLVRFVVIFIFLMGLVFFIIFVYQMILLIFITTPFNVFLLIINRGCKETTL